MNLDTKFNIISVDTPNSAVIEATFKEVPNTVGDTVVKDFEESRKNLQDIIQIGTDAVATLGVLASQSQNAEDFMALSSLIKNVSEVTSTLIKLHKQVEEIKKPAAAATTESKEYHNHLYVGSTSELSALLKKTKDEKTK